MDDRFDQSLWMTLLDCLNYVGAGSGESYAYARLREIDYSEANEQRCCSDDLEIDERFHAHPSYLSQRTCACDSNHDGREHQGRDDGFDQVNEDVAQKINRVPPIGSQPADHTADNQPDHDLQRQRGPIPRPAYAPSNSRGHRHRINTTLKSETGLSGFRTLAGAQQRSEISLSSGG